MTGIEMLHATVCPEWKTRPLIYQINLLRIYLGSNNDSYDICLNLITKTLLAIGIFFNDIWLYIMFMLEFFGICTLLSFNIDWNNNKFITYTAVHTILKLNTNK